MKALLRDPWIQMFGGVAILCAIIIGADHAARIAPPEPMPLITVTRPAEAQPLPSAPLPPPVTSAPKAPTSPLPLAPREEGAKYEAPAESPPPAASTPKSAPAGGEHYKVETPAEPSSGQEAPFKIIKRKTDSKWHTDIFTKGK